MCHVICVMLCVMLCVCRMCCSVFCFCLTLSYSISFYFRVRVCVLCCLFNEQDAKEEDVCFQLFHVTMILYSRNLFSNQEHL